MKNHRTQPSSSVKLTYEDYLLFPDDLKRHELIDGEHYVTPAPSTKHQRASLNLSVALASFLKPRKLGQVFAAPYDVVLSDIDVVQPDVLLVLSRRADIITEKNIKGAPDLVVEILSENTRKTDEIIKRKLYERFKVREYWVVDPELETVKVYRLQGKKYVRLAELSVESGDTLTTPLLADFRVPLSEIFS